MLINLGRAQAALGLPGEAEASWRRALSVIGAARRPGPDDPRRLEVLGLLATAERPPAGAG